MKHLYKQITALFSAAVLILLCIGQIPAARTAHAADSSVSSAAAVSWRAWVSLTKFGSAAGDALHPLPRSVQSYLCFELYDPATGAVIGSSTNYRVSLQIITPDGSDLAPGKDLGVSNSPHCTWDMKLGQPGAYTAIFSVSGSLKVSDAKFVWYVDPMEPVIVSETASAGAQKFIWGKDNWAFSNSADVFLNAGIDLKPYGVSDTMMNKLLAYTDMPNIDREIMRHLPKGYQNVSWTGACFGMTMAELLTAQGLFRPAKDAGLVSSLHDNRPAADTLSAINFFFQMQNTPGFIQVLDYDYATRETRTQKSYTDRLCALGSNSVMVNMCYHIVFKDSSGKTIGGGGHSVLAYASASGEYYVNGKPYDTRILIADPDFLGADKLTDRACMYISKQTGEWIIPYRNYTNADGSSSCCRWNREDGIAAGNGRIKDLLYHKSGREVTELVNGRTNPDVYYSRAHVFNSTRSDLRLTASSSPNKDIPVQAETNDGSSVSASVYDKTFSCAINDTQTSYLLSGAAPCSFDFMMDFPDNAYIASVKNTGSLTMTPQGYLKLTGSNADYSVMIVSNEGYCPTDWYSVSVAGSGINSMTFRKTDAGYVITADNLKNVRAHAHNSEKSASCTFSTDYKSALIYEINETTIGVKADADGDGRFETVITGNAGEPVYGDVNADGSIDIKDALEVLRYFNLTECLGEDITWSAAQIAAADVDLDGRVTTNDSISIQKFYHYKVVMEEPQTWYQIIRKAGVPDTY